MVSNRSRSARHIYAPVLALLVALVFVPRASAQTSVWNGGTGNWSTASGWSTGTVPDGSADILIGQGTVTGDTNVTINNNTLSIDSPGALTLQSTTTITLGAFGVIDLGGGTINGSGTIANNGSIVGTGRIDATITGTSGDTIASGGNLVVTGNIALGSFGLLGAEKGSTLVLDGAQVTGGTLNSGAANTASNAGFITAENGATITNTKIGISPQMYFTTLTGGSVLGIAGTVTNVSGLTLGSNGTGATINGSGTLQNNSVIEGTGRIDTSITGGGIGAVGGNLTLTGTVSLGTTGFLESVSGGTLVLDGAQVTGGTFSLGTLAAQNGAILADAKIGFTGAVNVTSGSVLGIKGTVTNQQNLFLHNATLNSVDTIFVVGGVLESSPGTLVNNSFVGGSGNLNVPITNNGAISAQESGQALVLGGDVSGSGTVAASAGGILTLNNVTVNASSVIIDTGSKLNGTGTIVAPVVSNGTVAPGDAPGLLTISGNYTQNSTGTLEIEIGGAGSGQFSVLDITGNANLGGALDVELFGAFDPVHDCGSLFGVCDTFDIVNVGGSISFFNWASNFLFPNDGLTWQVADVGGKEVLVTVSGTNTTQAPTPEPASLLLFGTGLIAISYGARRTIRRNALIQSLQR